jgi:glycosyltransferase involved in cell wall biosynthesis
MTAKRILDPCSNKQTLALFVYVGSSIDSSSTERLLRELTLLKRRFGMSVVLGMAAPETVSTPMISENVANGLLYQVVCSGAEDFILADLFSFASRLSFVNCILVDASDILDDFAAIVKFVVESYNLEVPFLVPRCGRILYCKTQLLRSVDVRLVGQHVRNGIMLSLKMFVSFLNGLKDDDPLRVGLSHASSSLVKMHGNIGNLALPAIGSQRNVALHKRRHLFVTSQGIKRLGGLQTFKELPLQIGGILPAQYDHCWVLENDDVTGANVFGNIEDHPFPYSTVKAISGSNEHGTTVVFDINPASTDFQNGQTEFGADVIRVPRQILSIRAIQGATSSIVTKSNALFIVSNYNKRKYIHATLYSLVMQSYPKIRVEFIDDLSADSSQAKVRTFKYLLGIQDDFIDLRSNSVNRGTYWIRNDAIYRNSNTETAFLINDSDDYSAAQRVYLQLSLLHNNPDKDGCLFDIVRTTPDYYPLALNGEGERYGTASLCIKYSLIGVVGYFQNIRKNADTEFIARVKTFRGKSAVERCRYPVLFQIFDGGNLTSDIYTIREGARGISSGSNARSLHVEAYKKHHNRIIMKNLDLTKEFSFPSSNLPDEYLVLTDDFLVDCSTGKNMNQRKLAG